MTDASIPDQYSVDFLFNDEWQVKRRFSDYNDASEYLHKKCEGHFSKNPPGVTSANFDYRLREINEVILMMSFRVTMYGRGKRH